MSIYDPWNKSLDLILKLRKEKEIKHNDSTMVVCNDGWLSVSAMRANIEKDGLEAISKLIDPTY